MTHVQIGCLADRIYFVFEVLDAAAVVIAKFFLTRYNNEAKPARSLAVFIDLNNALCSGWIRKTKWPRLFKHWIALSTG